MKSQELLVLRALLGQLQNSLVVIDDSVEEGNEQLKQLLTLKNCTKKELQENTKQNLDGSETKGRA